MDKGPDAFRTISEVAEDLDIPQHVLRFWETRFAQIKPLKRGGGRRYYRPDDVDLLRGIRHLLYGEGYTIKGVQRILKEEGVRFVQTVWQEGAPAPQRWPEPEDDEAEADPPARAPVASAPLPLTDPDDAEQEPEAAGVATSARESYSRQVTPQGAPSAMPAEHIRILEAVVAELLECQRLLAAARDTGDEGAA